MTGTGSEPRPTQARPGCLGHLAPEVGLKPYVVVSNNQRNDRMDSFLAARITTTPKPDLPSVVTLEGADPLVGQVVCDEVMMMWDDEIVDDAGALCRSTMRRVEDGLRAALGL